MTLNKQSLEIVLADTCADSVWTYVLEIQAEHTWIQLQGLYRWVLQLKTHWSLADVTNPFVSTQCCQQCVGVQRLLFSWEEEVLPQNCSDAHVSLVRLEELQEDLC